MKCKISKKKFSLTIIIIILILVIHNITYTFDKFLISRDNNPRFCIITGKLKDGGTTFYYGFGYQIIKWNWLQDKQIDGKDVLGVEHGFEIHRFPFYIIWLNGPTIDLDFRY